MDKIVPTPYDILCEKEFNGLLNEYLENTTDLERDVFEQRIYKRNTLKKAGEIIGKRPERVRQVESLILRKMHHPTRKFYEYSFDGDFSWYVERQREIIRERMEDKENEKIFQQMLKEENAS